VIFVFLIFLLVDFLGKDRWEKLFLFFFIASMGSIQLFCGYAEHYSLSYILIFAFIFLSMKYLKGDGSPFFPLLFFLLAVSSHISASYLLPSAFLLCVLGSPKGGKSSFFSRKETWTFLLLVVVTALILLYMKKYGWTVGNKYVPLSKGDYYAPGYSLFSLPHIVDIVNQQLLISPVGFGILASIWVCVKSFGPKDKSVLFLYSVFFLGMGFNFIMYPGLGMSRDWDLFSSTSIGYTILAGYLFLKLAKKRVNFRYLGSVLIITVMLSTVPWVVLNTSEQKGIERFRNLLELDPKKSRNGHYILAAYFDKKGLPQEVEKENQVQAEKFPELVLADQGLKSFQENKLDQALQLCQQALNIEPDFGEGHFLLGKIYEAKGVGDLAEREYRLALRATPDCEECYAHLGHLYVLTQRFDSASYFYKRAVGLNTKDPNVYNNLGNIYSNRQSWEKAVASYKKALETDANFAEPHYGLGIVFFKQNKMDQAISEFEKACEIKPDFALGYYHLAYLYAQKGERQEAEKALRLFSEYTSDQKAVENLKQMVESLPEK